MRRTFVALAAVSALIAAPVRAEPMVLQPASPWNIDYGADRCRLARMFSDGTDQHLLYFEQFWPASGAGLTVAGKAFKRFEDGADTLVQFADGRAPLETKPFKGDVDGIGDALIYSAIDLGYEQAGDDLPSAGRGLPGLDTAYAEGAEYLSFQQRSREVRFATGSLGKPFEALNQCTSGLITEWGLDAEQHKTALSRPRWINQDKIVRKIMERYPLSARGIGEQGIMRLRVNVSEAGSVENCVVIKATTTKKLESPACEVMTEAQFEPALDAAGKPMKSYFVTSITYKMN